VTTGDPLERGGAQADDVGLARTASLIDAARLEAPNNLLFDNGDLLQGNPMGDYVARARGLRMGEVHPMYRAMNLLGYDAANIGNHEFNYGLEFPLKSLSGADFPYVLANVYEVDGGDDPANDRHYFEPYVLLEREMTDTDGEVHTLTVGVIGFTPPQILQWDTSHLDGRVTVKGIVETAEALVPEMREAGADLVVAIPHSGLATSHPDGLRENATADLSKVDGIDAILFGHAHAVFSSESYKGFPGADIEAGTLNGALVDEAASRIVELTRDGSPVADDAEFVVVTDNYRASGGGTFPALDGSTIIVEAPETNRQVLVDYILSEGDIDPAADGNWRFAPLDGDVTAYFDTSPAAARAAGGERFERPGDAPNGFARYRLPMN